MPDVEITLHNVDKKLYQRCFNVTSTLLNAIWNPIGPVMTMNL